MSTSRRMTKSEPAPLGSIARRRLPRHFFVPLLLAILTLMPWDALVAQQLTINEFTGAGTCPTQGNSFSAVANATVAPLLRNTITCNSTANVFNSTTLNNTASRNDNSYIEFSITANSGYSLNLSSLVFFRQATNTAPNQLIVSYSTDPVAANFNSTRVDMAVSTTPTSGTNLTWTFPSPVTTGDGGKVTFRFYPFGTQRADLGAGTAATTGAFRLDNVTLFGTVQAAAGTPAVVTSTAGFNGSFSVAALSTTSAASSFTISGSDLLGDITLSPPSGFELSRTGDPFVPEAPLVLDESSGSVAATAVFVRYAPSSFSQFTGSITITSPGVAGQSVAVTGEVLNLSPGDIAFFAFQGSGPDLFRIVALAEIPAGSRIWFTDKSWDGNANALTTGEGAAVWTAPALSCGDVVEFITDAPGSVSAGSGAFSSGLGASGEQLFAFQGSLTNPSFVAGFTSGTTITVGATTGTTTYVPAALTEGTDFLALSTNAGAAYLTTGANNRLPAQQRSFIHNVSNWSTGATASWPAYTFGCAAPDLGLPAPGSLSFTTTLALPSAAQTFTISASNLNAPLVVTAPAGYQVREEGVGAWEASVSFPPAASVNKTIEVRLEGLAIGFSNEVITITSTGLPNRTVELEGEVLPPAEPTLSVSPPSLSFVGQCIGTQSAAQFFTLSGVSLNDAVDVTVGPLAGWTFSLDESGPFETDLSLTPEFGEVLADVWVRFEPATATDLGGQVSVVGGDADAVQLAVSGVGLSLATVSTGAASAITQGGATVAATLPNEGCSAVTAYGVEYSTTSGFVPGTGTQVEGSDLSAGSFSVTLTGLTGGTTYYYRAFATNTGGTAYGEQASFGTLRTLLAAWTYETADGGFVGSTTTPQANFGAGTSSLVGAMTGTGSGTGMNTATGCGPQTTGTTAWAIATAAPGTANESSGVRYSTGTLGYEQISVQWEQRNSNTAPNTVRLQYTTDGTTWQNFTMTDDNTTYCLGVLNNGRFEMSAQGDQFRRITVDLSDIAGVNNNPNFGFRVVAAHYQGTGQFRQTLTTSSVATGGTWRFDNVTVRGVALPPVPPTRLVVTSVNGGVDVLQNTPFSLTVTTQDEDGLDQDVVADTEVTIAYVSGAGGTLAGTLVGTIPAGQNSITFSGLTYSALDPALQLSASVTDGPALTAATATFPVVGLPTQLAFVNFPASGLVDVPLAAFTVEVRRDDNSVANEYVGNVTLSLNSGTGTMNGTLTQPVVGGVATFSDVQFSAAGTKTLTATSGSLNGTSGNVDITLFQLGAGNLVVVQAEASANNTTATFVELQPGANNLAPVSSFAVPGSGANAIRISGSATSTGYVALNNDRTLLAFTGHNADNTSSNANTILPRAVVSLSPNGVVNIAATYSGISGNQARGATSLNDQDWYIGDQGGIYTNNATAASPGGNIRSVKSFGGVVYALRSSASLPAVSTVSAITGGTLDGLPGLPNGATTVQDFYLVSSGSNGASFDVLYVLEASGATAGTLRKYSLVSGSWVANGTHSTTFGGFGLAAQATSGGTFLYVTTGTGATAANRVERLTDAAGYNASISINNANNLVLYTAPTGRILKGVDFAPQPCVAPEVVSITSNSPVCSLDELELDVNATGSGTLSYNWSGTGTFSPNNSSASVSVTGASTGSYSVAVSNSCGSANASVNVTVNPATAWYDDTDGDGFGDPNVSVDACEQPTGFVASADDTCPAVPGVIGSICSDGDPNTINDVLNSSCQCLGTPVGGSGTQVVLELRSNNGAQVSWEILNAGSSVVCSGDNYPVIATIITDFCELPDGCYRLRVLDSGNDGFGLGGGYQLRLTGSYPLGTPLASNVIRIIDNLGNFTSGSVSAIGNGPNAFCLPMSGQAPLYASRDKMDWVAGQYIVSEADADVSAQWQVGDQTDDGYEFWFFDPNGSYSFRRFRNHATNDGFANVGATRACHARINGWLASNHVPANRLMNVRIRARVNGVNKAWGPAFRFMIDPVAAACPRTKLMDDPNNPFLSCNQTRNWGPNNYLHARPVSGANRYQFRFRTAEGFNRVITSNSYFVQLNWATQPLVPGTTYDVDVRISRDGGATWCVSGISWGESCTLTIAAGAAQGGSANLATPTLEGGLGMWPNPNNGELLTVRLTGIAEGVRTVAVDIFDLTGKRVVGREVAVSEGGSLCSVLELNGQLATGVYLVSLTAGSERYTQRLVVTQ